MLFGDGVWELLIIGFDFDSSSNEFVLLLKLSRMLHGMITTTDLSSFLARLVLQGIFKVSTELVLSVHRVCTIRIESTLTRFYEFRMNRIPSMSPLETTMLGFSSRYVVKTRCFLFCSVLPFASWRAFSVVSCALFRFFDTEGNGRLH